MNVRRWARIVAQVTGALLMIVGGALVLGWLVGRVCSDRYGWSQWLAWIPTPAMLPAVALGLAGSLAPGRKTFRRRRRVRAWVLAGLLIAAYFSLVEHHLLRFGRPSTDGVHVTNWNLSTRSSDGQQVLAADQLFDRLGDINILLGSWRIRRIEGLHEQLGDEWTYRHAAGFGLITSLPIVELRPLVANDGIRVALFHVDATARIGRRLVIYAVDLPSDPKLGRYRVAAELRRLLAETNAPPPDVVVGDFNMTRGGAALRRSFPGFRHAYADGGHGYGATFPRQTPWYHIDHILVGDDLRAARYDLIDVGLGRHLMQRAMITADGQAASPVRSD